MKVDDPFQRHFLVEPVSRNLPYSLAILDSCHEIMDQAQVSREETVTMYGAAFR